MFKQITLLFIGGFLLLGMHLWLMLTMQQSRLQDPIATTFFKTPTTDQKKKALEDARKNALDKYIAGVEALIVSKF